MQLNEVDTKILLIEDNPQDVFLLCNALADQPAWTTQVTVVRNGEAAIRHLLDAGQPKPDLIIVGWTLPRWDRIPDAFRLIRITDRLYGMPVVAFSPTPEEVVNCKLKLSGLQHLFCVLKPSGINAWAAAGRRIRYCYSTAAMRAGSQLQLTSAPPQRKRPQPDILRTCAVAV